MRHAIAHSRIDQASLTCLGAGRTATDGTALAPPIEQSTTFVRSSVGTNPPHQYSRVSNPTVSHLETALGELEQAEPAVCFATGLAAETALFLSLLKASDHVVCGRGVYGGTTRLLQDLLPDLGIRGTFVDATRPEEIRSALRPSTRLILVETPSNPTLELTDIAACARIARDAGALLAVDNTFLTPILQQPLDLGADISVYSTTKFIDGHSLAMGGALVTRDKALADRFRYIRKCTGSIQTPLNAWLTRNGLKTLPLRIKTQSASASRIARWLDDHPDVETTYHPSLQADAQRAIAASQHPDGDGAVVSFEIQGGLESARRFTEALELCTLVEHVGSVETLLTHPATMTHADVPLAERLSVGISDGLLRLSVGLEPADAIIDDIARALCAAADPRTTRDSIEQEVCCHA
ncbi:MAG: trans-sulfuration enzyme family protein [Phycisphaerales bacterium JB043]